MDGLSQAIIQFINNNPIEVLIIGGLAYMLVEIVMCSSNIILAEKMADECG